MEIKLPESVRMILKTLHMHGYQAYIVGGCVRDSILGYIPKDWDITTDATPDEVCKLFTHTVTVNAKYGTVLVIIHDDNEQWKHEVTTYRKESSYSDYSDEVLFTNSLKEDLSRRDFTINALAYNEEEGLIDFFDGLADIRKNIIRAVADPKVCFEEDYLRLLRCLRFAIKYNFTIETDTRRKCYELLEADCLRSVAAERIHDEIFKFISFLDDEDIERLGINLTKVFRHTPYILINAKSSLTRLAGIYLDYINDRGALTALLKDLKFTKNEIKSIQDRITVYSIFLRSKEANLDLNYLTRLAISATSANKVIDTIPLLNKLIGVANYKNLFDSNKAYPTKLHHLAISGTDISNWFSIPHKYIGQILSHCLEKVLLYPELNTKKDLYRVVEEYMKEKDIRQDLDSLYIAYHKRFASGEQNLTLNETAGEIQETLHNKVQSNRIEIFINTFKKRLKDTKLELTEEDLYGKDGFVSKLVPLQMHYNKVLNQVYDNLDTAVAPVLAVQDSSVDIDALNEGLKPGKVLIYNHGAEAPKNTSPELLPADYINTIISLALEMLSTTAYSYMESFLIQHGIFENI